MSVDQLKATLAGEWVSIAPDIRPNNGKNPDGTLKPFYLMRAFQYLDGDAFELTVVNSADLHWRGAHAIAAGAQKVGRHQPRFVVLGRAQHRWTWVWHGRKPTNQPADSAGAQVGRPAINCVLRRATTPSVCRPTVLGGAAMAPTVASDQLRWRWSNWQSTGPAVLPGQCHRRQEISAPP